MELPVGFDFFIQLLYGISVKVIYLVVILFNSSKDVLSFTLSMLIRLVTELPGYTLKLAGCIWHIINGFIIPCTITVAGYAQSLVVCILNGLSFFCALLYQIISTLGDVMIPLCRKLYLLTGSGLNYLVIGVMELPALFNYCSELFFEISKQVIYLVGILFNSSKDVMNGFIIPCTITVAGYTQSLVVRILNGLLFFCTYLYQSIASLFDVTIPVLRKLYLLTGSCLNNLLLGIMELLPPLINYCSELIFGMPRNIMYLVVTLFNSSKDVLSFTVNMLIRLVTELSGYILKLAGCIWDFMNGVIIPCTITVADYAQSLVVCILNGLLFFCNYSYQSISTVGDVIILLIRKLYLLTGSCLNSLLVPVTESMRHLFSPVLLEGNFLVGFSLVLVIFGTCFVYYDMDTFRHILNKITHFVSHYRNGQRIPHRRAECERVRNNNIQRIQKKHTDKDQLKKSGSTNISTDNMTCCVCQENVKSVLLLPCKHLCLCPDCVTIIMGLAFEQRCCPLCRKRIENFTDVYI